MKYHRPNMIANCENLGMPQPQTTRKAVEKLLILSNVKLYKLMEHIQHHSINRGRAAARSSGGSIQQIVEYLRQEHNPSSTHQVVHLVKADHKMISPPQARDRQVTCEESRMAQLRNIFPRKEGLRHTTFQIVITRIPKNQVDVESPRRFNPVDLNIGRFRRQDCLKVSIAHVFFP